MEQTVIKVGNSLAVTLPRQFVRDRNIRPGQKVFVDSSSDPEIINVSTGKKPLPSITPEFREWLESFNNKYKKALSELARR